MGGWNGGEQIREKSQHGHQERQKVREQCLLAIGALCRQLYRMASFIVILPQAAEVSCGPSFTVEEAGKGGSGRIKYPAV